MDSHTVIKEARNSKRLFLFCTRDLYFSGISQRQAKPWWLYPPSPFEHASDQQMSVGLRNVMILRLIPWFIFGKKCSAHSCKSRIDDLGKKLSTCLGFESHFHFSNTCRRRLRKYLIMGHAVAAWFSRPMIVSNFCSDTFF